MIRMSEIKVGLKVKLIDELSEDCGKTGEVVDYDYNSVQLKLDHIPDTSYFCGYDEIIKID